MGPSLWAAALAGLAVALLITCCKGPSTSENGKDMAGKSITVRDTAYNTKSGAAVGRYRLEGLHSWPDSVQGKLVEATGRLKTVEHREEDLYTPDGLVKQGMVGTEYILLDPEWKLVGE